MQYFTRINQILFINGIIEFFGMLTDFLSESLSVVERRMLNLPVFEDLSISSFSSISVYFIYFAAYIAIFEVGFL